MLRIQSTLGRARGCAALLLWRLSPSVSALALSACSLPAGVDGNLVNNWAAAPAPVRDLPVVGDCYDDDGANMIDNHAGELHVAARRSTSPTSARSPVPTPARVTPPAPGSPEQRAAYAKCQAPTATFLGADWHSGLLLLTVSLPDADGWTGGARWFRCDVSILDYPRRRSDAVQHRAAKAP